MKKRISPLKAIRKYCLDCGGDSANEVKLCPCTDCALYEFRLGKNPYSVKRIYTDEQKQALCQRLATARDTYTNGKGETPQNAI